MVTFVMPPKEAAVGGSLAVETNYTLPRKYVPASGGSIRLQHLARFVAQRTL